MQVSPSEAVYPIRSTIGYRFESEETLDSVNDYTISDEFPEGGLRAWATVVGSFLLLFISQGAVFSFGVFQDYYTRIFLKGLSPSKIAWIGGAQGFVLFFLGLPAGKLFDEGYFRPLILSGSIIYIFSLFMLSFAKPHTFYQIFLAQGVGAGVGMGLLYVPSISICLHYFKRRRAVAVGIATLGVPIGAIAQTIALNHLLNGKLGFAWTVRILAFSFMVLAAAAYPMMRPRLPPKNLRTNSVPKPNIKKVVTDVPFFIAIMGASLLLCGIIFPLFYIQLFAILHGITTELAFYSISILNGASIIGRILMGVLADKYGALNTVITGSTFLGIVSFTMLKATDPQGLVIFAIFYGIISGGCISLGGAAISAFVDNISDLGFALGYTSFIQSYFNLVAPPLAGLILDAPHYRWNLAIIVASIYIIVAALCLLLSRILLMKRRETLWI